MLLLLRLQETTGIYRGAADSAPRDDSHGAVTLGDPWDVMYAETNSYSRVDKRCRNGSSVRNKT